MVDHVYSAVAPGIWPPALTAFAADGSLDLDGNEAMLEYLAAAGMDGVFVCCLTGELPHLSSAEILGLSRLAVRRFPGRGRVVCGVSEPGGEPAKLAEKIKAVADTGAAAAVVLVSELAALDEDDEVLLRRVDRLLALTSELPLGLYECPRPYHRKLGEAALAQLAGSGRFHFFKDTCCDLERIRRRLALLAGTPLRLFNANAATLLDSFRAGADGYCGVGANYYPALFRELFDRMNSPRAETLQRFIAENDRLADLGRAYPCSAKYMMTLHGVPVAQHCRITEWRLGDGDCARLRQLKSEAEALAAAGSR